MSPRPSEAVAPKDARTVVAALVVGVGAISFAAIFFKRAQPTHPLVAASIRLLIAAALLSPWAVTAWRAGRFGTRDIGPAAMAGLAYAVHFGAWVASLGLTSVTASVTAVTASPLILAAVGAITGKDAPSRRLWAALGVGIVGMAIIASHDAGTDGALRGDALALLGAAAMAAYLFIARRQGPTLDVFAFTAIATLVGGVLLALATLVAQVPFRPASDEALLFLVLAALLPQLVGHSALTWALRHTTPARVGMATLGEPVGSTILAYLWLGESVSATVVGGCAVTLCAVALALGNRES